MLSAFLLISSFLSLGASQADAYTAISDPYQDGYVLTLWSSYTDDQIGSMLDRVKQTGAKHITIPYFGCQTSIISSDVGACSVGSQDQAVREATIAISKGFEATFLPIVVTPKWEWRGTFNPTNVSAWFASYSTWLQGVAQIATGLQMKELIVGSEFTILYENEAEWSTLLKQFRNYFSGSLIVTVNWGELDYTFWSDADAIGISNYYPLTQKMPPSQADIDAGMMSNKQTLLAISQKYDRPLYFTEIGYASTNVAAKMPWQGLASDGANADLQAQCFDSFQRIWGNEPALYRANIWSTGDLTTSDYATNFETLNKPAETPIRTLFQVRGQIPSPEVFGVKGPEKGKPSKPHRSFRQELCLLLHRLENALHL